MSAFQTLSGGETLQGGYLAGGSLAGGALAGGSLSGGALGSFAGGAEDLEGGSPKGHKLVKRRDGTKYWKVVDKRFKHHKLKSPMRKTSSRKSSAKRKSAKRSSSRNPWIAHVKAWRKTHGGSYADAMIKAGPSYKKK